MKRVIAIFIAFILTMSTVVFADETAKDNNEQDLSIKTTESDKKAPQKVEKDSEAVFELKALGILLADENGDMNLENEITRAEFSAIITRLLNFEELAKSLKIESNFSDVPSGEWYAPYVGLLNQLNIMRGHDDGTFKPQDNVTLDEATKVLVCCLGYGKVAFDDGGYPDGYRKKGQKLGILNDIKFESNVLKRGDVVQMVYNALDIKVMYQTFNVGGDIKYYISQDETLRSNMEKKFKETGVVTANYKSYLITPTNLLEEDEVIINDAIYKVGKTNAADFIGRKVDFFVLEDEVTEDYTILSIRAHSDNKEVLINADDILELNQDKIKFFNKNQKDEIIKIAKNASILKNGRLVIDVNEKLTLENGYLEAIDNNGDGLRDVVFINEYLNGRVDRAKDNYVYFKELIGKIKALELDKNNSNVAFSIEDVNGKAMELKDIKEDDIISLFSSSDASVLKLIVSDKIVEGRIEEIRENKIVIDGTEYKVSKELKLKAGDEITAFLDFKGVVADFEFVKEKASQYGYVTGYIKDGLDYVVKVIMPGEFKEEMVSNLDEENPIMTAVLRGKNSNVAVYTLASKVNIIDETGSRKVDSDKLGSFFGISNDGILKTQRVIKYKLDSNGVIKSIETPKRIYDPLIGIDQKKTYNSYEKVFGKSGNIAFGADEHTNVLCIPDDKGVSSDNDYFATIDINNNSQYTISGFDMDEETEIADLIVITTTMDVDAEGTIDNKNEFAVVQEAATVFNEETGETEIALSIYNKGILQKRSIADIPEVLKIAENLKYGDVIYFADDADKVINKLKIIAELGNASQLYSQGSSSNEKFLLGKVDTIEFGKIDDVLNRRVNMVKAITDETSNISSEILLNERNPLPLYLVDNTGNKQSVSVIEPDEIRPNGEDKIFAHIVNYKLKCAVIVRD